MGLGFFIEMSMLALQGLYDNTCFIPYFSIVEAVLGFS